MITMLWDSDYILVNIENQNYNFILNIVFCFKNVTLIQLIDNHQDEE